MSKQLKRPFVSTAFTLVELLVSVALISLLSLLLVSMTNSTASTWRYTSSKIEQFRGATAGFEAITRRLSQATLNTYWDYDNHADPGKPAKSYIRQSDLRFIAGKADNLFDKAEPRRPTHAVFFQAPLGLVGDYLPSNQGAAQKNFGGLDNLINTWGYYVEFNKEIRPAFLDESTKAPPLRYRYRLMEMSQPSNLLSIYSKTSGTAKEKQLYKGKDWFTGILDQPSPPVHVLAENVIAMVLLPRLSKQDEEASGKLLTENYSYDSTVELTDRQINPKNQLPPVVQVTLVAIDEGSASRLVNPSDPSNPPPFDPLLDSLFEVVTDYNRDLDALQKALVEQRISYRVFTSAVSLRSAKWSTE